MGELEKGQINSILGAGARGVPQNNLNLEAVKFWQRFVLPQICFKTCNWESWIFNI
jgi:hypothetical protein